uniref:Uncharacterized protein n=1 Tax=Neobodo designis TaxID=312471 RepID=A0A7S1MJI8_NEODS
MSEPRPAATDPNDASPDARAPRATSDPPRAANRTESSGAAADASDSRSYSPSAPRWNAQRASALLPLLPHDALEWTGDQWKALGAMMGYQPEPFSKHMVKAVDAKLHPPANPSEADAGKLDFDHTHRRRVAMELINEYTHNAEFLATNRSLGEFLHAQPKWAEAHVNKHGELVMPKLSGTIEFVRVLPIAKADRKKPPPSRRRRRCEEVSRALEARTHDRGHAVWSDCQLR